MKKAVIIFALILSACGGNSDEETISNEYDFEGEWISECDVFTKFLYTFSSGEVVEEQRVYSSSDGHCEGDFLNRVLTGNYEVEFADERSAGETDQEVYWDLEGEGVNYSLVGNLLVSDGDLFMELRYHSAWEYPREDVVIRFKRVE